MYVELQQNFLYGDHDRNRKLVRIAREVGVPVVATNDVLYHRPERSRLQDALVAAKHNTTIDRALPQLWPNHHFHLKSPAQLAQLFADCPAAVANTLRVAERCTFDLGTDLGYTLPAPAMPAGYTAERYLRQLCHQAAARRYGGAVPQRVAARLRKELGPDRAAPPRRFPPALPGDRAHRAAEIMVERGLVAPDTPLEARPPGRGRGSSVALLVGYLIGISHVDPLQWNLTLERFISPDMTVLPDIDLDFPRDLRDELIARVHRHFGPEYAVLTGAISTYKVQGIIQDLGKALGLPAEQLTRLAKQLHSHDAADLRAELAALPDFQDKVNARRLAGPARPRPPVDGRTQATRSARRRHGPQQHAHPGTGPDSSQCNGWPVHHGLEQGQRGRRPASPRLISSPCRVLDQIDEALRLIEAREGRRPDLSRIDPEDPQVYAMINAGRSKGVFLLQSPAQLKMGQRLRARTLLDLAYQVALIRPGVGVQGSAVSQFRRALPARRTVGVRSSPGKTCPGAGLWDHRLAGAGRPTHHGRGRHDGGRGRPVAPRLRQAQQ